MSSKLTADESADLRAKDLRDEELQLGAGLAALHY
jgi:hypothetical protein